MPGLPLSNDAFCLVFLWAIPASHRHHLPKCFSVLDSLSMAVWCLILLLGLQSHITECQQKPGSFVSWGFSPKPRNLESQEV